MPVPDWAQMAAKPRYMKLRHSRWWFRMEVPVRHRASIGRAMIQENLRTSDREIAQAHALERAAHWKRVFGSIPDETAGGRVSPRDAYLRAYAEVQADRQRLAAAGHYGDDLDDLASVKRDLLLEDEMSRRGVEDTHTLDEANVSPAFHAEFAGMTDALEGRRAAPPDHQRPFSVLAKAYLKERQRDGSDKQVKKQTEGQMEAVYRLFSDHVEDAPLASITDRKASLFFDKARGLVSTWGRSPKTKERTLAELLALSEASEGPRLSDKTLFRYMVALGQLWDWGKKRGEASGDNPFRGLVRKPNPLKNQRRPNLPWSDAAIRAYFAAHPDRSTLGELDEFHWLPRIGLLTGMRLDEICSLDVEDIKAGGGVRYFDITAAKSVAGVRQIPLHQDLLPLLKKAPKAGPLFPHLVAGGPDEKKAWNVGKRLGRQAKGIDGASRFHGLRKNVTQTFERAHVPESEAAQIVGHGPAKRGFTYATYSPDGLLLDQKLALIRLLSLPSGILAQPEQQGTPPTDQSDGSPQ